MYVSGSTELSSLPLAGKLHLPCFVSEHPQHTQVESHFLVSSNHPVVALYCLSPTCTLHSPLPCSLIPGTLKIIKAMIFGTTKRQTHNGKKQIVAKQIKIEATSSMGEGGKRCEAIERGRKRWLIKMSIKLKRLSEWTPVEKIIASLLVKHNANNA